MFLRKKTRHKDGKEHRHWSIVENRRVSGGRTAQRHVLCLGEVNDNQRAAWCQTIEAFDEASRRARQIALFPEDRPAPALGCDVVHVRLSELRLRRPRQWGACWLACELWGQLALDDFWSARLPPSRQGTRWLNVPKTLVAYRLIDPGSEWRLHRQWYEQTAMGDLLGEGFALASKDKPCRCLDKLIEHKAALFGFLQQRWKALFQAEFDVLLYDLTSTYFESDPPDAGNGLLHGPTRWPVEPAWRRRQAPIWPWTPPLPFKLNHDRRHHIPRQRRKVVNWRDYDASLRQRGSLTVWFTAEAIAGWRAEPRTTPGGQPWYSPLAILTALTLRAVFRLALRQAEGLIGSVIGLLGLALRVPDHSTLSGIVNFAVSGRNETAGPCWRDDLRPRHLPRLPLSGRDHQPSCPFSIVLGVTVHPDSVGLVDLADAGMRGGGRALSDG